MERQSGEKSRRERRKEARKETKQRKNESWLAHQKSKGLKKADQFKTEPGNSNKSLKESSGGKVAPKLLPKQDLERMSRKEEVKDPVVARKNVKEKHSLKRKPQTGFEEFLQMEMQDKEVLAHEDLEAEKRLAKKLKVKDKMLRGMDDGLNDLLGFMPSSFDSFNEDVSDGEAYSNENIDNETSNSESEEEMSSAEHTEEMQSEDVAGSSDMSEPVDNKAEHEDPVSEISSRKRRRRRKKSKQNQEGEMPSDTANRDSAGESVDVVGESKKDAADVSAPLVGVKYIAPHLRSRAGDESEEHTQIRRRIRGLLNRLTEFNIESITGEMVTIFRSLSRSVSTQIITAEVLAACSVGPRGNKQYAAVFAAFIAGMACSVGQDFGAKLMAAFAKSFEDEYRKEDNLSLRNLTLLLSHLYIFGVCSSDLIYDFLIMLSKRLTEVDVSTILTVLQCCGMKIRGDDPAVMKNFIQTVQSRVNELKASSTKDQEKINGKRMEFMLETICDIKNNKKSHGETSEHTRIKKWLQKLGAEDILLRGLKWSKLLDPHKKGQWWLSGDLAGKADDAEEVANTIDKEMMEAQKMLQLATSQRMNTDTRKAIFCIIMSGEDYVDAFEKLLRLDLPGKQDREIMRVLVECCLQEKVFNKYYTVLASKLCEHEKNHKFTLQFCIRDHFKELESMSLQRSMHLAKFVAEMVASFVLSLSVVKTIDFDDASQLTPKRIMHFRMLFESIFEYPSNIVWNTFSRLAGDEELEPLRHGMEFFTREYVVKPNKALASKFKLARRALNNVERVLM